MDNHQGVNWQFGDEDFSDGQVKRGKFHAQHKVLNNSDILTDCSNRRLTVHNLNLSKNNEGNTEEFPLRLRWSIDRLTVVGKLKKVTVFHEGYWKDFEVDTVLELVAEKGYARRTSSGGWIIEIVDGEYRENVGYFERVKHDDSKGRFDFNPNKLALLLNTPIKDFLASIFESAHYSRADIACDIFDLPNEMVRQYDYVRAVTKRPIYAMGTRLQTIYWGSAQSERQVRLYDKVAEQLAKKEILPPDVKTWWRLEFQLRGKDRTTQFEDAVTNFFEDFVSPLYIPVNLKGTDRVTLVGLLADSSNWNELAKATKAKYRKIIKSLGKSDALTQVLRETYFEQRDEIQRELDYWLNGLNIVEDMGDNENYGNQ